MLTGPKMEMSLLKIKDNVDLAILLPPLPYWKIYTSNNMERKLVSPNNNWLIAPMLDLMVTMDAMEDGLPLLLTMSETVVLLMKITILIKLLKNHARVSLLLLK